MRSAFSSIFTRARRSGYLSLVSAGSLEAVGSVVAVIVLARTIDPGELGQVFVAQSIAGVLFTFGDPRFDETMVKFFPAVRRDQGSERAHGFYRTMRRVDAAFSLGLLGTLVVTTLAGAWSWSGAPKDLVLLAGLSTALVAGSSAPIGIFSVTGGLDAYGRMRTALAALTVASQIGGALVAGAAGYLIGAAAASGVSTAVYWVTGNARAAAALGPARPHEPLGVRRVGRFTAMASLGTTVALGVERLPMLVLAGIVGPVAVARYRVALAPGRSLGILASPIAAIQFPDLSHLAASDERSFAAGVARLRRGTWRAAGIGLAVAVVVSPALLVAVPLVYGDAYEASAAAACWAMGIYVLRFSQPWAKFLALVLDRPGLRVGIVATEAAVIVALTALLAERWPLGGPLVAFGAGSVLAFVLWDGVARRAVRGAERPAPAGPVLDPSPATVVE